MKKIKLILLFLLPMMAFSQVYIEPIEGEEIVEHIAYTLSYNETYEQPNWVSYVNTTTHIRIDSLERGNSFRMDKAVSTKTASNKDYSKSGFDKGHMAPAADMLWNKEVIYEANYLSNASPQYPGLNRGPWLQLESKIRAFSYFQDSVYVLVGPVFSENMKTIGGNNVAIPMWYFKIMSYQQCDGTWNIICYMMPNKNFTEEEKVPLESYRTSISDIEKVSGLNFKIK